MIKLFLFAITVLPSAFAQDREIADLAAKLREQIVKSQKKVVAILEISNSGNYTPDFSDFIIDELTNGLVSGAPGFRVVTRSRLTQLLKERNLRYASEFDAATFKKIGEFSGADTLITGSYRVLASSLRLNLQILDVSDAAVIASGSANLPKTPDVDKMLVSLGPPSTKGEQPASGVASQDSGGPQQQAVASTALEQGATRVALLGCKRQSSSVNCELQLTRLGPDMRIDIYQATRFFDQEGNVYSPPTVTFGTDASVNLKDYSSVYQNSVKDVMIRLRLSFSAVPPTAKQIEVLEVAFTDPIGKVQFRKVPLQ